MSTQLWKFLSERSDATERETLDVCAGVKRVLDLAEPILAHAATGTTDYTLHDADHAFRVAERMFEIVPTETRNAFSSYELALLLLSAYLHDIGMTPRRALVQGVHRFLAFGPESCTLDDPERVRLQYWLDGHEDGAGVPWLARGAEAAALAKVDTLTAEYARVRHNDWSEAWVRDEIRVDGRDPCRLGAYQNWLDDLVALCRSHHEGYESLIDKRFDARFVARGEVVNLRYLAALLRIADVLDIDPERTPDVVFRHRLVSERSQIFWAKDHQITLRLADSRIHCSARPETAVLHQAIRQTLDQIDTELALCHRLSEEHAFRYLKGWHSELPHRWLLGPACHRDLEPKPGSYVFIEGSFRPNAKKLLELLGGHQLYGDDPFVAVRELLTNAFDAVKESIARHRLTLPNPADTAWEYKLGELHQVELRIEQRNGETWLVCEDDGAGMNREIVERFFLVGGSSRRRSLTQLERQCRTAGFELGRSGQFGIGVLSYFMVADRLELLTRRNPRCGDDDGGWSFITGGPDDFGELRSLSRLEPGTRVSMRLVTAVADQLTSSLRGYVARAIRHVPSRVVVSGVDESIETDPGWVLSDTSWTDFLLEKRRTSDADHRRRVDSSEPINRLPVPPDEFERRLIRAKDAEKLMLEEMRSALEWHVEEGVLPDGSGRYRIRLPVFRAGDGRCLFFSRWASGATESAAEPHSITYSLLPNGRDVERVSLPILHSWKGIATEVDLRSPGDKFHQGPSSTDIEYEPGSTYGVPRERRGDGALYDSAAIEFDWQDARAARPDVSRHHLRLGPGFLGAIDFILDRLDELAETTPFNSAAWLDSLNGRRQPREIWWKTCSPADFWQCCHWSPTVPDPAPKRSFSRIKYPTTTAAMIFGRTDYLLHRWREEHAIDEPVVELGDIEVTILMDLVSGWGTLEPLSHCEARLGLLDGLAPVWVWVADYGQPGIAHLPPAWSEVVHVLPEEKPDGVPAFHRESERP